MSPPSDGARPVAPNIEWVCTECAYTGSDFRLHTDRESGHVDDVICGRCGSPSTEEIDDTSLREIAETIKKERADYDALRAEVGELTRLANELAQLSLNRNRVAMEQRARAEAAEAKVARVEKLAHTLCRSHGVMSAMILEALNEGDGE